MNTHEGVVPLAAALDPGRFGGKAANLARALRAGLPVPDGVVLPPAVVRTAVAGQGLTELTDRISQWASLLAVRSSAIGEDGAEASFAGQHLTRLGVRATEGALRAAITAVAASMDSPHARAYRQAMSSTHPGVTRPAEPLAVLIQPLVPAAVSGVMFTCDPVTGTGELVVEAVHGLGEAVVGGQVTPELCRMLPDGTVRQWRPGQQKVAVIASTAGGTQERPLDPSRPGARCLNDQLLTALTGLAQQCQHVFGDTGLDIEWSWAAEHIELLQARPITALDQKRSPHTP